MGLTKQYLRYDCCGSFNAVCGSTNGIFIARHGKVYCAVGANDNAVLWDIRKGEKVFTPVLKNQNMM